MCVYRQSHCVIEEIYLDVLWEGRLVDIRGRIWSRVNEFLGKSPKMYRQCVRSWVVLVYVRLFKRGKESVRKSSFTSSRPLLMLFVSGGVSSSFSADHPCKKYTFCG